MLLSRMKKIVLLLLVFLFNLCVFSQKIDFQIESGNYSNCKFSKVKFKNTSTYSLNDCNYYKWVFGNGDTLVTNSIDTPVEYSYNQHGSFKPVLLGYKKEGNNLLYVGESYNYYSVNLSSPITFSTSSEAYCPGETVNFNYSNYSTLTTTPKWDFGNGRSQYSTYGTSTTYEKPGEYTVKLIYEHNYCDNTTIKDTLTQIVKISSFVQPKPDFNIPEKVCPGEPISLYSNNQAVQYEWDMGDKNVYYSNSATHKYKESWKFDVTLTLTNACGNKKSVTKQIEVTKTARTNFGKYFYSSWEPYSDKVVCLNEPVKFDFYNSDNYQSISWNFGDQTILSNVNKGEHIYTSAKDFVLQLKLVDFCNNDTILKRNISVKNSVPFGQNLLSAEVNLCPGETHYFSSYSNSYGNDKNIKSFQWILPNNQFFSNSFSKSFNTNTNIQLKLQDYCGRDTIYNQQIKIVNNKKFDNIDLYIGTLNHSTSGDITICPNQQFNVRSYSDDVKTISCDYGNGVYGKIIPYSFSQIGSYPIKIKVSNYCGNDSILTRIVNVKPIQINSATIHSIMNGNSSKVCVGDLLYLDIDQDGSEYSSIKTYEWDFGDGSKGYGKYNNHIYSNIGRYTVKVKLTNLCDDTLTIYRTFEVGNNNIPAILDNDFISIIDRLCPNESFDFKIFGRYKDVVWNFGDNTSTEKGNFVSHKFSTPGFYSVTVNLTNQCGNINSYTEQLEVRADIQPESDFDFFENEICPGENMVLILEKENPNDQFTFDFGDNSTSYKKEMDLNFYSDEEQLTIISHKYQSVGEKLVTVNVKNACGNTASYQEIVSVRSDLNIKGFLNEVNIEDEFNLGDTSLLYVNTYGKSFEWNLGDNTFITSEIPIIKHHFTSIGLKKISVKVTTGCGESETYTQEIFVTPGNNLFLSTDKMTQINDFNIYPNPSTGKFKLTNSEALIGKKFSIYDIMGKLILTGVINEPNEEINLNHVYEGSYFLNVEDHNTIKLIKF